MALSRSESQGFFDNLGLDLDNNEVLCFKCASPLYYKSYNYQCKNNHKYTYQDVVFKFSASLYDLKKEIEFYHTCGVQMGV
jgi:hypothetical protein